MKQLEPEIGPLLAEQRLVGFEADVAPAVEVQGREAVGQRWNRAVEGRGGEILRPLHNVRVAEWRRRRGGGRRRVGLGGSGRGQARAGSNHDADEQRPAGQVMYMGHSGWAIRLDAGAGWTSGDRPVRAMAQKRRYSGWCARSLRAPC